MVNRYLVDTNIWSALLRRQNGALLQKFAEMNSENLFLSPIVCGELELGFQKGDRLPVRRQTLDFLLDSFPHLVFDSKVSRIYAEIRADLESKGTPIGRNDTWIAAEALHHNLVLVSDNMGEFARVQGLKLENWL